MENPIEMDDFGVSLFLETPTKIPWISHTPWNYGPKKGVKTSRIHVKC